MNDKVKRFMWVLSPNGLLHIKYGNTSEGYARCGAFVAKGWHIVNPLMMTIERVACKRCQP